MNDSRAGAEPKSSDESARDALPETLERSVKTVPQEPALGRTGGSIPPTGACYYHHPDARRCLMLRHIDDPAVRRLDPDDRCECMYHASDVDELEDER
jgi:hypothetical protein